MPDRPKRSTRSIEVGYLARVEGEGALSIRLRGDEVTDVQLRIFEPPRFFEGLLRGRLYQEAPDITARICGICPIAYQMGAVQAMESIFGVRVEGALRDLRRLIYCGEWIESHVLHIAMLHAPDFLGYEDAIRMAKDHPEVVRQALRLKKLGNRILAVIGGREVHPINLRVGGFYRLPTRAELAPLREELEWARGVARELVRWTGGFSFPDFERDYEFVALRHGQEYPITEGRIVSSSGLDIPVSGFEEVFVEEHVAHSNALQATMVGRGAYHVGPLARYALNFDCLPELVQEAAREVRLGPVVRNPFQSIVVRSLEVLFAVEESIRLIEGYQVPAGAAIPYAVSAGTGHAATEAPRGICYHRYQVDAAGLIEAARIVPPTSQNQKTIEGDLWGFVPRFLHLPDDQLQWQCEQAVRNYDPCISCATHFLRLTVERT